MLDATTYDKSSSVLEEVAILALAISIFVTVFSAGVS